MAMKQSIRALQVLSFALFGSGWAQQLSGARAFLGYPGLSSACLGALETNVSCPPFLNPVSASGEILNNDMATELCTSSCYMSLKEAKSTIQNACAERTDVIVYGNIAYPGNSFYGDNLVAVPQNMLTIEVATFIIDNYLYTYNVSCMRDRDTGAFCDPQFLTWSGAGLLTTNQSCSDCWLGTRALQMSSPLGYDPIIAENLASLTSACNATVGYGFSTPTPYALNSTSSLTVTPAKTTAVPTCTVSYTVQPTDNCNSVALAHNVSTYSLLWSNHLDLYCQNFASVVNSTICIPQKCSTYRWQGHDTCDDVTRRLSGVTVSQFLSWNPMFDMLCRNSVNFLGYAVCLSPPGGVIDPVNPSNGSSTQAGGGASVTSPVPLPTNAMPGSKTFCGGWYTVAPGDTCALISSANSLSLFDFYFLNQEITGDCANLEVGEAYCIKPVGTLSTYSGYPTTAPLITVTPATFPSVDTGIPTPTSNPGFIPTYQWLPHAPGTLGSCQMYQNYTESMKECTIVSALWGIDTKDLLSWNPSLSSNLTVCELEIGLSYCVVSPKNGSSAQPQRRADPHQRRYSQRHHGG